MWQRREFHDVTSVPHSRLIVPTKAAQSGSRVVHQKIVLCAGVLAFGLAVPADAPAQPVAPPNPSAASPTAAPALPPYEIVTIVRSAGLEPLTRPVRSGPAYALRAYDHGGQEVRVLVDVHSGRIVKVTPVPMQRFGMPIMPPVYGRPPAPVPDGYGPNSRIAGLPSGPLPAGAPGAVAPPNAAVQTPPLPRPRPKVAAGDAPAATPAPAAAKPPPAPPAPAAATPPVASKETTTAAPASPPLPPADEQAE